jgi:hypothetical protein
VSNFWVVGGIAMTTCLRSLKSTKSPQFPMDPSASTHTQQSRTHSLTHIGVLEIKRQRGQSALPLLQIASTRFPSESKALQSQRQALHGDGWTIQFSWKNDDDRMVFPQVTHSSTKFSEIPKLDSMGRHCFGNLFNRISLY